MAVVTELTSACLNVPVQQSVWIAGIHAKDGNEQLIESEKVGEREGMGVTGRGGANKKAGKERILIRALFSTLLFSKFYFTCINFRHRRAANVAHSITWCATLTYITPSF